MFQGQTQVVAMNFAEILQELPMLTSEQRQLLICRASELDEPGLSPADEQLVESRLAAHRQSPETSLSLDEMKRRLRVCR